MTSSCVVLVLACGLALAAGQGSKESEQRNVDATEAPTSGLTRCYGKYGCFSVGEPFLSLQRPINLFPVAPEALDVQFLLRTRRNNHYYQKLKSGDADSFSESKFDGSRPTMFVIHGYLESGYLRWVLDMTTELLTKDNYNVIVVDWGQGATPPYTQAVANARIVGSIVADMIKYIQDRYDAAGSDFHLIGYNVGAHIAGYAGERVSGIGRITGLDPAEPYFAHTDKAVRLDPTDAEFVDVIHTGGSSFQSSPGSNKLQDYGHVDFYPNGGEPLQCPDPAYYNVRQDSWIYGVRRYVSCADVRAHEYFSESINSDCPFYGFTCEGGYRNFSSGACTGGCGDDGSTCAPMGYRAVDWRRFSDSSASSRMFLTTAPTPPYCRNQYYVRVMVASTEETRKLQSNQGTLYVQLHGSKPLSSPAESATGKHGDYTAGKTVDFLISARDLGRILRVNLEWRPDQLALYSDPTNQILTPSYPRLLVHHARVMNLATGERFIFCGEGEHLEANIVKTFFSGGDCEFSTAASNGHDNDNGP
ncbi:inactive pancreatic lipase-related protein 1-like isoform X2 [Ornithodoros turicata]|uniref:inactive pancreatic lipase-related protein 1-like isoform X2 n=1 Tax=Ornithodoros turicata TaxID=34597 RepID=UPI003138DB9B